MKIRTQIILPFLLLMVILGVVGTYLTTSLVATSLEERIGEQLIQSQNSALDAAVKLQGRQVAGLRLIANTEGVDQAVKSANVNALRQLLVPIEVNNRLGTVIVFDVRGHAILQIDQPDPANPSGLVFKSGADLSQDPVVKPILQGSYDGLGDKYIGYEGTPVATLAAAGPILAGDQVVGGVLLQTRVPALLAEMKVKSQAQVLLLDQNGRLIGSSIAGVKGSLLDDRTRASLLQGRYLEVPESAARRLPPGSYYAHELVGLPVATESGTELGVLSDILERPANDVWVAHLGSIERLIPATREAVVAVDLKAGRILVADWLLEFEEA